MLNNKKKTIKTVLLGQSGVGKTSIVQRYINKIFTENIDTTIGAAFNRKNITEFYIDKKSNLDNTEYNLEIWDTAGQERYNSLLPMYYRGSDCVIMVYDITNLYSFNKLKEYLEEIDLSKDVLVIVIGNKTDMEDKRMVKKKDVLDFCNQKNITYIESSAKENQNIEEIFIHIIKSIDIDNLQNKNNKFINVDKKQKNTSFCCKN